MNALPVIDTRSTYTTTLPVLNKAVQFKPYGQGDEKTFLIALENKDMDGLYINLVELVKRCMVTKDIDFNSISAIDLMKLIIMIRSKAKGEALMLNRKCPIDGCDTISKIEIPNIEEILKIKNLTMLSETVKINETLAVDVVPMTANYMRDFLSVMQNDTRSNMELLELGLDSIAYAISKIMYDGKIYTGLNVSDIKANVLINMTEAQLALITAGIKNLITMYFEVPFECSKCGHKEVILEENFFAFLL